jgi:hypothetical protein
LKLAAIEYEENLPRDVKKRRRIPFFFLLFLGGLQIDRLLRGETVVFAVELDVVESTRAAAASGDERNKDRETEVGERRLMAASAAKRERRLKEIFSAEGHCSAERKGRDEVATLDATRQALINAFHLLLNQLCLLLAFIPRSLSSRSSRPMTPLTYVQR